MIQIKTFSRSKMRNNELLTFYTEVREVINTAGPGAEKLNIQALFAPFEAAIEAYSAAILNISKSALTEQIEAADAARDNLFVGICEVVRTGTRHFKAATQTAAKSLMPIIDAYMGAATRSIDDETSYITNFMNELSQEKNSAALTALGLIEWIENLSSVNTDVQILTAQRTREQVEAGTSTGAGMRTRTEVDATYDTMVQMLNALCMVGGEAKYLSTFEFINARIKHYQDVLAQRQGKSEAKKKAV